jgi:hypothetical protein
MSWWRSKREPSNRYQEADALYDAAVDASQQPGHAAEAERLATDAVAAYRRFCAETADPEAKRRLGKALWRQSTVTGLLRDRREPAIALGVEGVAIAKQALNATPRDNPSFDDMVREVGIALNDLAQLAGLAGRRRDQLNWLSEAREISERSSGPSALQSLGTSLHNLAAYWLHEMRLPIDSATTEQLVRRTLNLAESALAVRRRRLSPLEAVTTWELANSLFIAGLLRGVALRDQQGVVLLEEAQQLLVGLGGPSTETLRAQVSSALQQARTSMPVPTGPAAVPSRPCPCGSGAPFVDCHGKLSEKAPTTAIQTESGAPAQQASFDSAIEALVGEIFVSARALAEPLQNSLAVDRGEDIEVRWLGVAFEALSFYTVLATRMAAQARGLRVGQLVADAIGICLVPRIVSGFLSRAPPALQHDIIAGFLAAHHTAETEYGVCMRFAPTGPEDTDSMVSRLVARMVGVFDGAADEPLKRQALVLQIQRSVLDTERMNALASLLERAASTVAEEAQRERH